MRLDHLRENALVVQRTVGLQTRLVPMVKADAYGLGMAAIVRALADLPSLKPWAFGVATVTEGEGLRVLGWEGRVLVFSPTPPDEFPRAGDARLTLCLSDEASVRRWAAVARGRGERLPMHVEVDTGMGRAGFPWDRVETWSRAAAEIAQRDLAWEGCFTHFHSADEPDLGPTDAQWERFRSALRVVRAGPAPDVLIHVANSAAALRRSGFGCDLARPGIFLYGGEVGAETAPLPVAAVRARLVRVQDVPAGSTVGYGATHVAHADERWGTLAIGYGDGLPRALWPGRGEVLFRGRRIPIVGRISMDMTTVDLSAFPDAAPGEVVTLIGADGDEQITVDEVAARCGTISYEILTGLTPRLPRVYLGEQGRP